MLYPFRVLNPTTIEEATGELARLGERAKIYAGGTELLVLHRYGLIRLDHIINVKKIAGLRGITYDESALRIGATATHHELERDLFVRQHLPAFSYAESQIANIRVRNQGTLGGNLSFCDPHSDPGTVLLIHEASVKVAGKSGARKMALGDFFQGSYETALRPDELLVEVEVPLLPGGWSSSYLRIQRLERPMLGVAAAARLSQGRFDGVRLAVGCIGPQPLRLTLLEQKLMRTTLDEAGKVVAESVPYLKETLEPVDDLLGSIEYKLYIARVLVTRALKEATQGNGASS